MKRRLITFFLIVLCFLLESTLFQALKIGSACPNLMVIITVSIGFMRGQKPGMEVGFVAGLFVDLFWGSTVGAYMMVFAIIGYAAGSFRRLYYDDDLVFPAVLAAAGDLFYGLAAYTVMFMLQGDFAFWTYLSGIILPEMTYTMLVTLVLYPAVLKIHKRLDAEEQRSASKFV